MKHGDAGRWAGGPVTRELSGWGRFPRARCRVLEPASRRMLQEALSDPGSDFIPRGLGRSYGDSSLNDTGVVLKLTRLNRFLSFDPATGVLHCEAGVSIAEIGEHFLPRGWFVPVTPGTKHVTVGGAIAADIHGKNHHVDGSFGGYVDGMELLTASGEVLEISPTRSPDLFRATVGGMGLTGVILSARIRLRRVSSPYIAMRACRARDLEDALRRFADTRADYRYSVAWIDCLATGRGLGRSVLLLGNDATRDQLPARSRRGRPPWRSRARWTVPVDAPAWLLAPAAVRAFNACYYAVQRDGDRLVDYEAFFYPLDRLGGWNRLYGRGGFLQYQVLFPGDRSEAGLAAVLEAVAAGGRTSFLAVMKSTGPAGPGLLSYPFPGHTLALDIPVGGLDVRSLVRRLDGIVLRHGGRLYLAKDALLTAETFSAMYPDAARFREIKNRIDPDGRFVSCQARRLGIA